MEKIFADLNDKQLEAVKTIDGPVLVFENFDIIKLLCLINFHTRGQRKKLNF